MSGGSYNYFYRDLEQFITDVKIDEYEGTEKDLSPERAELIDMLEEIVPLLKAIEWTDSGDSGEEDEKVKINEFLDKYKG